MAKAINHGIVSGAATVGSDTAKGALLGFLSAPAVGALIGAAVFLSPVIALYAIPAFIGAASVGTFVAAMGAAFSTMGVGSLILGLTGGLSGGLLGIGGAGITGGLGGAYGLFKGVSRISHEKSAFDRKLEGHHDFADAKIQNAYVAGAQAGQAQLIEQIQAAQEQEQAKMAFVQREEARRAAAAQAPATGKA